MVLLWVDRVVYRMEITYVYARHLEVVWESVIARLGEKGMCSQEQEVGLHLSSAFY